MGKPLAVGLVVVAAVGLQFALQGGHVNHLVDVLLSTPVSPDGNWALVDNFGPSTDIPRFESVSVVEGALPSTLHGAYARVGPNPVHVNPANYHW
jgi:hypothetical protein